MSTRKEIATKAAKIAAASTYKAIMDEKVIKTASKGKGKGLSTKAIAKASAAATYSALLKMAQQPLDPHNLSMLLAKYPKAKELYDFYQANGDFSMPRRQFHMGGYSAALGQLINDAKATYANDPAAPNPQAVSQAINDYILNHIDMTDDTGAVANVSMTPEGRLA